MRSFAERDIPVLAQQFMSTHIRMLCLLRQNASWIFHYPGLRRFLGTKRPNRT